MTMTPILPSKALDSHVAVLGKTGSGKTYAAKGLVELLIESGGRVCIIDPTGAWWGLKSSATGKSAGLPVTIFGGPASRSDMPIQAAHGAVLGEVIATSPGASIIDLSEMGVGEQHRFVEAFAAAVYLHNKLPLHLVIDEANEFAPQKPMPDAGRALANTPSEMPTLSALHERWFTFCSAAQTKMLRVICSLGPDGSITRDDLGAAVGMDLAGGYGSRIVGELKTLGVITYPQKGSVAPTSLLFPEGLA